ncbi:MAG: polysaccharide pyruvyl transferase protein, partial [Micavibrio sp.]|nr:polysaccharide pyruvyl transferase protein [Micavibrio sp.]
MSNTVQIIESLQQEIHRALGPLVPASGKFALLDFPNHSNVGDSAIWLGEIEYFKNWHKMRPAFVSNFARHSTQQLKKALPEGTIFIHGGGNFGDLWTHHQDFREKILQEFPDRKVVQLPQSLHFETAERLKQAQSIINAHPDFTLLVRDHKSHAFAREHFNCTVILCPDMAFALGPQKTPVKAEDKPLFLLRMDKERSHDSVGNIRDVKGDYRLEDWLDEEENLNPKILKQTLAVLPFQLGFRMLNRNAARAAFYNRLAQHRVTRGLRQL